MHSYISLHHTCTCYEKGPHFLAQYLILKRSLMDCSPWGHKESDMTEKPTHIYTRIHTHTYTQTYTHPGSQECVLGKGMKGIHES